jgi:hypothetical protein
MSRKEKSARVIISEDHHFIALFEAYKDTQLALETIWNRYYMSF